MIARFIGGSKDGETDYVFDDVPSTWHVPAPVDFDRGITESLSMSLAESYAHDGWYIRWSTGERIPIYLFKGSS